MLSSFEVVLDQAAALKSIRSVGKGRARRDDLAVFGGRGVFFWQAREVLLSMLGSLLTLLHILRFGF